MKMEEQLYLTPLAKAKNLKAKPAENPKTEAELMGFGNL